MTRTSRTGWKSLPAERSLSAATDAGALHGLETFVQMIVPAQDGFSAEAFTIEDKPRFPWRGLMLDVSRHWMPVAVVERNLDGMAAVKMNVFHWHLSDDQGFRVESRRFPKLQQLASDGHFYTQAEVRQVIAYAEDRGIRVVPEFDIPGHTTALLTAYPELASAPGPYQIERTWGIFKPTLDPTREATYTFLDAFIGEMAALFPDPYFHIGGDEVDDTQWKASASIQAFAARHGFKTSDDLQAYFNRRVQVLVRKHGKIMMGWDEILHEGIPKDVVIQSWRGQESLAAAAKQGYRGILSFGYYLDHMRPASFHYLNDPEPADLSPSDSSRVMGGEACMWNEYTSPETVDSRIWPRAGAIAERLWSPAETKDIPSLYNRLALLSRSLEWLGVRNRSNYGPMLDRLAGGANTEPVRIVADAVEALGGDDRYKSRSYTNLTPLNRLADAARPESETVREMEGLARTGSDPAVVRMTLTEWSRSADLLKTLPPDDFLAAEVRTVAQDLAVVGSIGLRALDYLESQKRVSENWITEQKHVLDGLDTTKAEVRLAAARPVRILLDALTRAPHSAAVRR